jgi:hypothetical protein
MNERELEKKRREVAEVEPVAAELNLKFGTDYIAVPSKVEPADVLLESPSRAHPDRPVQVVSIPHDYEIRADNNNLERLKTMLTEGLEKRAISHCFVGLTVLGNATKRGMPPEQVEHLADELRSIAATLERAGAVELDSMQLLTIDPELTAYISNLVLLWDANHDGVIVETPGVAAELPDDGSWIEQGIRLKVEKYGGPHAVKDLMLVIGVEALVDRQQVEAFAASHPPDNLPFAEIWINSMEGVICLKPRND